MEPHIGRERDNTPLMLNGYQVVEGKKKTSVVITSGRKPTVKKSEESCYRPKTIDYRGIVSFGGKSAMGNQEIAARLETIYEKIKNYPTPIAGCDEQFNFLLSERDRLRNLLATDQQQYVTAD